MRLVCLGRSGLRTNPYFLRQISGTLLSSYDNIGGKRHDWRCDGLYGSLGMQETISSNASA
jgi:hypothetical protein